MTRKSHSCLVLLIALLLSACRSGAAGPAKIENEAGLVQALIDAGATVERGESVQQEFFGPQGHMLSVNGADVQVFEYPSAEAMEQEAEKVAPNGGSVGTSMIGWVDAPHFYKTGRILVLYVGSDQAIIRVLKKVLGEQFAGR